MQVSRANLNYGALNNEVTGGAGGINLLAYNAAFLINGGSGSTV